MGSFWEAPLKLEENKALLDREKSDLLHEMTSLPANAAVRRINELVKRARSVKVHAYIIHYLRKQMPYMIGKSEKQRKLLDRLDKFVADGLLIYFIIYIAIGNLLLVQDGTIYQLETFLMLISIAKCSVKLRIFLILND